MVHDECPPYMFPTSYLNEPSAHQVGQPLLHPLAHRPHMVVMSAIGADSTSNVCPIVDGVFELVPETLASQKPF